MNRRKKDWLKTLLEEKFSRESAPVEDNLWTAIQGRIPQEEPKKKKRIFFWWWFGSGAGLLLAGLWYFFPNPKTPDTVIATKITSLAETSTVDLNASSSESIPATEKIATPVLEKAGIAGERKIAPGISEEAGRMVVKTGDKNVTAPVSVRAQDIPLEPTTQGAGPTTEAIQALAWKMLDTFQRKDKHLNRDFSPKEIIPEKNKATWRLLSSVLVNSLWVKPHLDDEVLVTQSENNQHHQLPSRLGFELGIGRWQTLGECWRWWTLGKVSYQAFNSRYGLFIPQNDGVVTQLGPSQIQIGSEETTRLETLELARFGLSLSSGFSVQPLQRLPLELGLGINWLGYRETKTGAGLYGQGGFTGMVEWKNRKGGLGLLATFWPAVRSMDHLDYSQYSIGIQWTRNLKN